MIRSARVAALCAALALFPVPASAQLACATLTIPEGASAVSVAGHSVDGPRCFDVTPGAGRGGVIEIVEGNGTLVIEGVTAFVRRHAFAAGPWTYYITVSPDPLGSAGGAFTLRVSLE